MVSVVALLISTLKLLFHDALGRLDSTCIGGFTQEDGVDGVDREGGIARTYDLAALHLVSVYFWSRVWYDRKAWLKMRMRYFSICSCMCLYRGPKKKKKNFTKHSFFNRKVV